MPREGSREIDDGIIISEAYDWCRSPTAIVPYRIWARQREAADLANSVRQSDDRSHVNGSLVLHCYGDEAGVGGGVVSGTHNAECTPKTWSSSVRAEDRNMVRHDDEWWMNHKNTWGRLYFLKDTEHYQEADTQNIEPKMYLAQYVGATPMGSPLGPIPGPAQGQQLQNVGKALQQGYQEQFGPGTMPIWQRPAANMERLKEKILPSQGSATQDAVRVTGPPGDCSPEQHRELQDRVNSACKGSAARCTPGDSIAILAAKIAQHTSCIAARTRINNACFKGGDLGHNIAITDRYMAIQRCWSLRSKTS